MNTEFIKQRLRKYRLFSLHKSLKRKMSFIIYLIKTSTGIFLMRKKNRLRMSFLYQDHMILQCEEIIHIKGQAIPGEWVTVRIAGQENKTCVQSDGCWEVELSPLSAGGPYTLAISTRNEKLLYKDVYAGEVWLCSGQSNMAISMGHRPMEKSSAIGVIFRYFQIEPIVPAYPIKWNRWINYCVNNYRYDRTGAWEDCREETIRSISAIAYSYGEVLSRQLGKPIGLIINPVGGTAEYCWIERRFLQKECPEILTDWYENTEVTAWMKGRVIVNIGRQCPEYEQLHPFHPGYCFESFIRPIKDYAIKGVIWYSGESSAQSDNYDLFKKLQELLVRNWREAWGKCFPFYYVQLAGLNYEQAFGKGKHYYYPEIRNSHRQLLKYISKSGMAVSYDLSVINNNHVSDHLSVGKRLARLALYGTYKKEDIVPCGPLFHEAVLRENLIYIRFEWSDGLCTKNGSEPKTFEVAGRARRFFPASAWIEKNEVVLSCPEVTEPYWVHYAFEEFPIEANLVNGEGLPAACFEDQINRTMIKNI